MTGHRLGHLAGCGWFWAWAAVGVVFAVSIEILPLVLVAATMAAAILTLTRFSAAHVEGALTGFGLPFLYVAYLNRHGSDNIFFTAWPWLVIGIGFIVSGIVAERKNRRASAP